MKNYKNDFPIFNQNSKDKQLVYLDSAATSQKPRAVLDAMDEYYKNYNSNVRRGLYPIAEIATQKVEEVRNQVARFINARDASEIIFVRNSTEAINLVMNTWGDMSIDMAMDDVIVATIMEHHSNFVPWQFLAQYKETAFVVIDITGEGYIDVDGMYKKIKNAKILAITHVSNVLGTINPIKEIIKKIRIVNPNITILIDGAQAVPHMKVDVQDLDCDFYVFSGHKMIAATGIGILYGKKKLLEEMPPFLFGGEMIREVTVEQTTFANAPFKFEAGTPDIAGIISLGAAIDYLEDIGMEIVKNHEKELLEHAFSQMEKINGLTLYGPKDIKDRSGVISFNIKGVHAHDIAQVLGDMNICIRAGHHCAMPLHKHLGIVASARISVYIYNTKEDIDLFISGLKKVKEIFKV
ncbi:MAG: hypothetical protein A3F31_03875 [Candidatus Levybacteria bacterium RIFCSPHIGHO2_12_FULL_38_12]|nr:MAG: hypothetical protein A3F31_03875 [Candidatus Levybacteria bacterium RIFCSPHIGHO2_12_FULL_38_12]